MIRDFRKMRAINFHAIQQYFSKSVKFKAHHSVHTKTGVYNKVVWNIMEHGAICTTEDDEFPTSIAGTNANFEPLLHSQELCLLKQSGNAVAEQ